MDVWMEEWVENQSRRLKAEEAAQQSRLGRRARLARRLGLGGSA